LTRAIKDKLNTSTDGLNQAAKAVDRPSSLVPALAPVPFYLGKAIRSQVGSEAHVDAEEAFRPCLEKGARVGKREEVRRFLDSIAQGLDQ
jgi:hypothetical protein